MADKFNWKKVAFEELWNCINSEVSLILCVKLSALSIGIFFFASDFFFF